MLVVLDSTQRLGKSTSGAATMMPANKSRKRLTPIGCVLFDIDMGARHYANQTICMGSMKTIGASS
jgi:hypothetical protein